MISFATRMITFATKKRLQILRKEEPVAPVKPVVKQEPKGKEKLFSEDEEELDEKEIKKRKAHEANWMSTNESSERLKKKKEMRKRLRPLFKERSFYYPSGQ
ncbi:unnamed protein product [Lactuca virosa]|uniref:Uncharacterized protein n=1 Tax=Lactuca virosa TaxID=75947 RepID=A0AAU9PK64_9ASTR|nr:unnamed protein product [Lactuca virosa]